LQADSQIARDTDAGSNEAIDTVSVAVPVRQFGVRDGGPERDGGTKRQELPQRWIRAGCLSTGVQTEGIAKGPYGSFDR
jgi:hypothetical protein